MEQMTWLARKSHRSSAPSNEQGRNGARPDHSPGAAVPHAGAADVGPRDGGAETAGPPDPPDARDTAKDSGPQDTGSQDTGSEDAGSEDAGPQDTGEWQSAIRAAAENTAFRAAASRSVWPGTEDRRAEPAPAAPQPSPGGPGVSSFGPLGAGLPPDTGQAGRSARPDEQIWEPRRLYQQPRLKPRRRGDPASPNRHTQPQPAQQPSQQQGPPQGTAPRNVRSGKTAVPKPESPKPESPKPEGTAQQGAAPQHRDVPVRQFAITAGSDPARGSGPYSSGPRGPSGPSGQDAGQNAGPGSAGTEYMADRLHLGDLMADSRMRIWKRRLLVAIVAGLVFTFIFTWRAGLTAAVLAAVADAIYRSRTTASMPPGVRLTGAQKRTQRQLARMERSGYRALHSRPIPGSREFIDHFVVGPTGAYAIDSESWDKRLPIRTRNARQLYHGPFTKKDRLEHARWEAQQASDRLTSELGTPVFVRPVLAIYGPKVPWHIATIREVDVFDGDRLRRYLRRNAAMRDGPKLSAGEIEQIYATAARVLRLNNGAQRTPVG